KHFNSRNDFRSRIACGREKQRFRRARHEIEDDLARVEARFRNGRKMLEFTSHTDRRRINYYVERGQIVPFAKLRRITTKGRRQRSSGILIPSKDRRVSTSIRQCR